ncbi:MAG: hypothetical protein WC005_04940 [Candidatus Nanopelagicales bacterium]
MNAQLDRPTPTDLANALRELAQAFGASTGLRPASSEDARALLVEIANYSEATPGLLTEMFSGGLIAHWTRHRSEFPTTYYVAIINGTEATAITTTSKAEADTLYTALAHGLGILTRTCEVCRAPIPAVQTRCQYCPE